MNNERATALYKGRAAFLHYSLTASGDGLDFALHHESLIELQGSRCRVRSEPRSAAPTRRCPLTLVTFALRPRYHISMA